MAYPSGGRDECPHPRSVILEHVFGELKSAQAANSVCSLPRLRGKGGEGVDGTNLRVHPHPNPPPQAGEGTHRVCRAICASTWPEHAPEPGGSSCATLGRVHAALRPGHTAQVKAYGDCRAIARQQHWNVLQWPHILPSSSSRTIPGPG